MHPPTLDFSWTLNQDLQWPPRTVAVGENQIASIIMMEQYSTHSMDGTGGGCLIKAIHRAKLGQVESNFSHFDFVFG